MIEVVGHHGRLSERTALGVIVPYIEHSFAGGIFPQARIQHRPVAAVPFGVDTVVEFIKFWMILVNPVQDDRPVVSTQVQVLQPDQDPTDALDQIDEKGYDWPFMADNRKVFKIGATFSSATKRLENWVVA